MRELAAALARPPRNPGAAGSGGQGKPVTLLPVLVDGLTIEDLGDAQGRLYGPDAWPVSHYRPPDDVLQAWAALLKGVTGIVSKREDQARCRCAALPQAMGLSAACGFSLVGHAARGSAAARCLAAC